MNQQPTMSFGELMRRLWSRPETKFGALMWAAALAAAIALGMYVQRSRPTPASINGSTPTAQHSSMTPYQTGLGVVVLVMGGLGSLSLFIAMNKTLKGLTPHSGAGDA